MHRIPLPPGFLWGAATSAHQTEGANENSDWWALENMPGSFCEEPSGQAVDSFHRWAEDMDLAADAGLRDYRFSIEWARVEPEPGVFSGEALKHYRHMIEGALQRGLRPLVTLHHFTCPAWFAGWADPAAPDLFARYVAQVAGILDDVEHVATINEPNVVAAFPRLLAQGPGGLAKGLPEPEETIAEGLVSAHRQARHVLRTALPEVQVGWSISVQDYQPDPPAVAAAAAYLYPRQTRFLLESRDDDWVGVQAYTRVRLVLDGDVARPAAPVSSAQRTQTGWEYYPAALGGAVREAARVVGAVPVIVTENGVATGDDDQRIAYTHGALTALAAALDDGIDVRGYFHWSLLDNYEWGSWGPTFGLVSVDRGTFVRSPKPSLAWLGRVGTSGLIPSLEER
ncbi:beta-glucosidase [Acrocarpospora pleiomorpha]|uniref:Beta-glucosidase n=1 Tax=Acrocarpospora pleiomorpha TaxID=90975 RepID=A0A5M3Y2X2_9ACTN|nr:family 1 glycosylhydrolase [Acrocarpospora pleiomorpha]GES26151.1 beta-glucosidase [Acrocarpospora pleiomorpha]